MNPKWGQNRSIRNRNTIFLFLFSSTDSVTQLLKPSFLPSKFAPFFPHFLFKLRFLLCLPPPPPSCCPQWAHFSSGFRTCYPVQCKRTSPGLLYGLCHANLCEWRVLYVCTALTSPHNVIHGRWYSYYKQVEKEKVWKFAEKVARRENIL
jgi:hypothetical protein